MNAPSRLSLFASTLLNSLLRGEIAAVEAYLIALDTANTLDRGYYRLRLRVHRDRIQFLRAHIETHGRIPCECSGPWVALVRTATKIATRIGSSCRRTSLAAGESLGTFVYQSALIIGDSNTKHFLRDHLLVAGHARKSPLLTAPNSETTLIDALSIGQVGHV